MPILFDSLKLLLLFIALGWSADLAVKNIKYLGAILKVRLLAFGILLGLITSLPELALGIDATINQAVALSVGNLLGGIVVMLGFILGTSLFLNKKIATDGRLSSVIPIMIVIFSPIVLGIDGKYGLYDGLTMLGLYIILIFLLYQFNHFGNHAPVKINKKNKVGKSILLAITGIIGVIVASHWIIGITLDLLEYIQVSQLVTGLIIFSVGTNLPEMSIAITSWRKKSAELSLSHLLGSSFTNVMVLGILAFINPIIFETNSAFWIVAIFLGIILILFTYFYYSKKKMDRREGIILLAVYVIFVILNLYLMTTI